MQGGLLKKQTKSQARRMQGRTKKLRMHAPISSGAKHMVLLGEQLGARVTTPIFLFKTIEEVTDPREGYTKNEAFTGLYLN